jgi:hypothetical protein
MFPVILRSAAKRRVSKDDKPGPCILRDGASRLLRMTDPVPPELSPAAAFRHG